MPSGLVGRTGWENPRPEELSPIQELLQAVARLTARHWGDLEYVVKEGSQTQHRWQILVRADDAVLYRYDHIGPVPEDAPAEALRDLVSRAKLALSGPVATSVKVLES